MYKPAQTTMPIHPLLASRWSPRAFDDNSTVSSDIIIALKEAARWAPSCFGAEPWRFIFCNKAESADSWKKLFSCLAEGNRQWVKNAQLLILACAQTVFAKDNRPNRHCQYDTGAAALSLVLEAENQGLRAHQMGGFDAAAAQAAFAVPEQFECLSVIAVGYQAAAATLPPQLAEGETATRSRQSLGDCFFDGAWGKTAE